ncbi:hypothetical protein NIES4071_71960 [Calothrix sp. NIES-4071]|nr:hypothetical protein NIES4071_71960 [Calothrix sp. NIES-4071]BAZ61471.1 hypothetical protein NIES4105_71910 [Calothrix sp. NIES-4105]
MSNDLLKNFQEAYRNLEVLPLLEERDLERFRVDCITNECCRICLRLVRRQPGKKIIIDNNILDEAINNIRNDFAMSLGRADYQILQVTYQNFKPEDPKQREFLDLLHGLYVLEYRNRQIWYDVHPVVVELLRDEGLIS